MSEPDLTPEEQQVRRLLAEARSDEPLPDDVAARLDGMLADLGDETRRTAPVVDLAARRRRRIARNVLVAAAAVVVIGVGVSRVDLGTTDGSALSSDSDAGSAASSDAGGAADAPQAETSSGGGTAVGGASTFRSGLLDLRSDTFERRLDRYGTDRGLASLADTARAFDQNGAASLPSAPTDLFGYDAPASWCNDAAWGQGARVAVRYDGQRGVLVLRKASSGSRDVDLFLCGDTTPTRSTTVPAG